jgi:hypothetical protein
MNCPSWGLRTKRDARLRDAVAGSAELHGLGMPYAAGEKFCNNFGAALTRPSGVEVTGGV